MNIKLVESLVEIIDALTPEEQTLLEKKLQSKKTQPNWQEQAQKLQALKEKIFARRGGKPLEPSPEEIIHQMREERTEHIRQVGFSELYQTEE